MAAFLLLRRVEYKDQAPYPCATVGRLGSETPFVERI